MNTRPNHLSLFAVEQLPVVPPDRYDATRFGPKTAGEVVREAVLELTYTAHDMAPFARDMGYLDADGDVLLPFAWDEERRLNLRAKLDAVFFHLYGVNDRDDVRYVYSTFPIVRARGDRRLRHLPLPRPLPRLDERPRCRSPGRGGRAHAVVRRGPPHVRPTLPIPGLSTASGLWASAGERNLIPRVCFGWLRD